MVPPASSAKRKRPTKGYQEPPDLPSLLRKQVKCLSAAGWQNDTVADCLKMGKCVPETQALLQSSEKAAEQLSSCRYADRTLVDQVAGVYTDLRTALDCCVQNGVGDHLVWCIFESSQHGDMKFMEEMYRQCPPVFVLEVLRSMQAVHHAAKTALSDMNRQNITPD